MRIYDEKKPDRYNCASCKGEFHECLMRNSKLTLTIPNKPEIPPIEVGLDNWLDAIDHFRCHTGNDNTPDYIVLSAYNLCAIPLITPFSFEAFKLHQIIQPRMPAEHYGLPAVLIQAGQVIDAETSRLAAYDRQEV